MKIMIKDGCIGCGLCVSTCPNVFRMTEDGVAEVFAAPDADEQTDAEEAAENCPVSVIQISED